MNNLDIKKMYSDTNSMFMARIELTTICNWRCKHCYIDDHVEYGLTKEELFQVLDKMRDFGVFAVEFTGGEIFTRPDLIEIIQYARELNFYVSLLSNLSLLNDDIIDKLDELSVEGISTTLFSMNDEINDKITGGTNSASIIIDNLKKLSKTKLSIEVKTILMRENASEYHEIQNFCQEYGFDFLVTEGLFPTNEGNGFPRNLAITCEQLQANIEKLDVNRYGSLYKKKKSGDDPICSEVKYSMSISADGECYPCNLLHRKLGNIRDYGYDISLVWHHPFLEDLRSKKWKDLTKCSNCDKSEYCVRCTGIVDTITGDLLQEDPFSCRTAGIRQKIDLDNNHI